MESNTGNGNVTERLNRWLRDVTTELRALGAEGKQVSRAIRDESLRIWREVAGKAKQRIDRWVH